MKIAILITDIASNDFIAEHGLSIYIEHEEAKVLLDAGYTNNFIKNAQKLGINLDEVKNVVLSHGHWDHGNGLQYLQNKNLICHPEVFTKRYRNRDNEFNGLGLTKDQIKEKYKLIETREPYHINENIVFLGEIPRKNTFEAQNTAYYKEDKKPDFIKDDSAIAINTENGIVVITGCAHAGVCNTIEYSKRVFNSEKILAVIGGFHITGIGIRLDLTINCFEKDNIKKIYPMHCTCFEAMAEFYRVFGVKQLKSGDVLEF